MSEYEYRVIAAPTKGVKAKGKKTAEDRFSNAIELKMNEMAREGWEYQRAEALPSTERAGLTSTKTVWHNLLVFRRKKAAANDDAIAALPAPKETMEQDGTSQQPAAGTRQPPPLTAVKVSAAPETADTPNSEDSVQELPSAPETDPDTPKT